MTATRPALGAVRAGLCAAMALVAACGSTTVPHVSLAALASSQSNYAGEMLTTDGTVQKFSDSSSTYYVISDAADDRVELQPSSKAASYNGRDVQVTGTLTVDPSTGRVITVTEIGSVTSPSG